MLSSVDCSSSISPETRNGKHEFEWLLCLAGTLQTCQCQQKTPEHEARRQPLRRGLVAAAVKALPFWPQRSAALRKCR